MNFLAAYASAIHELHNESQTKHWVQGICVSLWGVWLFLDIVTSCYPESTKTRMLNHKKKKKIVPAFVPANHIENLSIFQEGYDNKIMSLWGIDGKWIPIRRIKERRKKTNNRGRSEGGGTGRGGRRENPSAPLFEFKELSGWGLQGTFLTISQTIWNLGLFLLCLMLISFGNVTFN